MDQESRDQFTRLFNYLEQDSRTIGVRFETLESRMSRDRDESLTNFDGVFKQLGDLKAEYHSLSGALGRVEAAVSRFELEFREDRIFRQQGLHDVETLRARTDAIEAKLTQIDDDHEA